MLILIKLTRQNRFHPEDAGLLCVHFSAKERAPRGRSPWM